MKDNKQPKDPAGFVKDLKKLEEHRQTDDLFGHSVYAEILQEKLGAISLSASIMAIIGPYGIGKTFLLDLVRGEIIENESNEWLTFEAWGYPDRKELWVAFLSEIDRKIENRLSGCLATRWFKRSLRDINRLYKHESLVLFSIAMLALVAFGLSAFLSSVSFLEAFAFSTSFLAFTLSVINLYYGNPLIRREGYESIVRASLKKFKKTGGRRLFMVLEDVDRSGDHGLLFIETLALFLRRLEKAELQDLTIRVLVPVSNESFRLTKERNSFLKAIDHQHYFGVGDLDTNRFVDAVFRKEFVNDEFCDHINKLFRVAFQVGSENQLNLRTWKTIIRGANDRYTYLLDNVKELDAQPLVCVAVEITKYLRVNIGRPEESSLFEQGISTGCIGSEGLAEVLVDSAVSVFEPKRLTQRVIYEKSIEINNHPDFLKDQPSGVEVKEWTDAGGDNIHYNVVLAECYLD